VVRINILEGGRLAGWFDPDQAEEFSEATDHDGANPIGVVSGMANHHQSLYRTKGGRWVLAVWSDWQGTETRYQFLDDAAAREWAISASRDDLLASFWGELEEESGPGRPAVGGLVNIRLGEMLGPVDAYAAEQGVSRPEAVRQLLAAALAARS